MKFVNSLLIAVVMHVLSVPLHADNLTVEADGSGDYATIQDAISAATDGDVIWMGDGIYTGPMNKNLDLDGKAIVVRSFSNDPTTCIIDCQSSGHGFNIYHGETADSQIRGITIRNGNVAFGGGIRIFGSSPSIENCVIETCFSYYGGGGLYCTSSARPVLTGCVFVGNQAQGYGGGIYSESTSAVTLVKCVISSNTSGYSSGGGVYLNDSSAYIINTLVINNLADHNGGGLCIEESPLVNVVNCTICDNVTSGYGGGVYSFRSSSLFVNTIVWNNTGSGELTEFYVLPSSESPIAENSLIGEAECPYGVTCTNCLFDLNPDFIAGDDYHLTQSSPCIDTGTEVGAFPLLPQDDFDGNFRPHGVRYDIGFDEVLCINNGDVDGSGGITATDAQMAFYIMLGVLSPTFQETCAADCDGSGSVTAGDAQLIFFNVLGLDDCVDPI